MHLPDQEAVKLITTGLLLICNLLIVPFALKALAPDKPLKGGLHFLFMQLPLLLAFSYPDISLSPLDSLVPILQSHLGIYTWLFRFAANAVIFSLTGYLFIKTGNLEKTGWFKATIMSFLLTFIYVFSFDTGLLQLFR